MELPQLQGRRIIAGHEPAVVDVPEGRDNQVCFAPVLLGSLMPNDFWAAIVCCPPAAGES